VGKEKYEQFKEPRFLGNELANVIKALVKI